MKNIPWIIIFEWALRINVCVKLFIYGVGKLVGGQFYLKDKIPEAVGKTTLSHTSSYDLAWTFFGHSQGYILFIGISQLVGVALLISNKTKIFGALILIPILLNIIAVDYFFGVARGALFSACFYLVSLFIIVYTEKKRVLKAIGSLVVFSKVRKVKLATFIFLISTCFALIFVIELAGITIFGYENP